MNTPAPNAVILLSGGLDSAVAAAIAIHQGRTLAALSFDYGQRHRAELHAAAQIAKALQIQSHTILPLDLRLIGGSALTADLPVPKNQDPAAPGVPVTYVPARNLTFLAIATALAETTRSSEIWIGVNAIDYSGYPDCRPEFIDAFQTAANRATKAAAEDHQPLQIVTPLKDMTKADIVRAGAQLAHETGLDLALTHSCYDPPDVHGTHCGACDACQLRQKGFAEAKAPDPTRYANPAAHTTRAARRP